MRLAFTGNASEADPARPLDKGIVRTVWMTPAEIETSQDRHRSPLVWRCVQDHIKGKRFDLSAIVMDRTMLPLRR